MKIYYSESTGSIYYLGNDGDLYQAPLLNSDGIIDLDMESGGIAWGQIDEEEEEELKEIMRKLNE
jgi:hypothetical protein